MIAEPLEKGLAEDIENEVVQITWNRYDANTHTGTSSTLPSLCKHLFGPILLFLYHFKCFKSCAVAHLDWNFVRVCVCVFQCQTVCVSVGLCVCVCQCWTVCVIVGLCVYMC